MMPRNFLMTISAFWPRAGSVKKGCEKKSLIPKLIWTIFLSDVNQCLLVAGPLLNKSVKKAGEPGASFQGRQKEFLDHRAAEVEL